MCCVSVEGEEGEGGGKGGAAVPGAEVGTVSSCLSVGKPGPGGEGCVRTDLYVQVVCHHLWSRFVQVTLCASRALCKSYSP